MTFSESVQLERYKYVLSQKKQLNESTQKTISLYQALIVLVISAQALVWFHLDPSVSTETYRATFLLSALDVIIAVTVISFLFSNAASWRSYGIEEQAFYKASTGVDLDKKSRSSIWRWLETYVSIAVPLVALSHLGLAALLG